MINSRAYRIVTWQPFIEKALPCISFFDLRLLITPLVSSNFIFRHYPTFHMFTMAVLLYVTHYDQQSGLSYCNLTTLHWEGIPIHHHWTRCRLDHGNHYQYTSQVYSKLNILLILKDLPCTYKWKTSDSYLITYWVRFNNCTFLLLNANILPLLLADDIHVFLSQLMRYSEVCS
jgi:hypothetical protein